MRLVDVAALLECQVKCCQELLDGPASGCFAADLMSDVLAFCRPHALLVTGLASVQAIHTANVADCCAVLLASGKQPSPDALQLARARHIPVLVTDLPMFSACARLAGAGLDEAARSRA